MKALVITMIDEPQSVQVAERCIESGKKFGVDVEIKPAITPKDNPIKILKENLGADASTFPTKFSKLEPVVSCFLSHYFIWAEANEETLVLEHDAVFYDRIDKIKYNDFISIGEPSFGRYNKMNREGTYSLFSKGSYLPGAHAYMFKKHFAKSLIEVARRSPYPCDVFLNSRNFPTLQEYWPWPVKCEDEFSFIQKESGCKAKHNYNDSYKIY